MEMTTLRELIASPMTETPALNRQIEEAISQARRSGDRGKLALLLKARDKITRPLDRDVGEEWRDLASFDKDASREGRQEWKDRVSRSRSATEESARRQFRQSEDEQ